MARPIPTDDEEERALRAWLASQQQPAGVEESPYARPELPEQSPGPRPESSPMAALAQFNAPQSAPRVTQAQSAAPAKDPYSGTDLALAALADLFLNKGRGMGGIISLGAQNQDNDWETQQRQMKLDEAAARQQGEANQEARYAQADTQALDERTYQRGRDARSDSLAERQLAAAGPAADAKAQAARDEWDRQQATMHANRMEERAVGKRGKGGAVGGGGGADAAGIDALRAEAARTNDTAALSEALPTIRNPKQREKVVADIARIEAGKRGMDAREQSQAAPEARQRETRELERIRQEQQLDAALALLDQVPEDWHSPDSGNIAERGMVATKKYIGGGSGMSNIDTMLNNALRMAGNAAFRDATGQVANVLPEQEQANQLFRSEGSAKSARALVMAQKKRLQELREADNAMGNGPTPTASDGAPKINGAAQRGQSAGGSVTVRDKQGNTKRVVDSPKVRALIQSGEIQLVGGNGG